MKVAICLFGNLRTYQYCSHSLRRHVLEKNDCDVFIHTWSTLNHGTQTWHKNYSNLSSKDVRVDIDMLYKCYSPKEVQIDDQADRNLGSIISVNKEISISGISYMLESMHKVNQLRRNYAEKHGIEYDYVLFTRPDIFFEKDLNVLEIVTKHSMYSDCDTIYTACHLIGKTLSLAEVNCTDLVFFAKPRIFDDFFQKKSLFLNLFERNKVFDLGPEYFFIKTYSKLNYSVSLLNFLYDRDFYIVRLDSINKKQKSFTLKQAVRVLKKIINR